MNFGDPLVIAVLTLASAVLGGYIGSRMLIRNESKRHRQELIGSIQVARSEFTRNAVTITWGIGNKQLEAVNLSDHSYRTVEPILATGLPMLLFSWLGIVSDQTMRYQLGLERTRALKHRLNGNEIAEFEDLRERLLAANRLLLRYLRERLHVNEPVIKPEDKSAQIERQITAALFGKRSGVDRVREWLHSRI